MSFILVCNNIEVKLFKIADTLIKLLDVNTKKSTYSIYIYILLL